MTLGGYNGHFYQDQHLPRHTSCCVYVDSTAISRLYRGWDSATGDHLSAGIGIRRANSSLFCIGLSMNCH
ncbi:hypothetical protein BD408DRAFT_409710 [Parasitella parasitica]|nr:hypothetical protein BD408DRAFT_409710 [Parasitella parasitica]